MLQAAEMEPVLCPPHSLSGPADTHVGWDARTILHRVSLHSQVIHLAIVIGEHKVLPRRDVLAELRLALRLLQQTLGQETSNRTFFLPSNDTHSSLTRPKHRHLNRRAKIILKKGLGVCENTLSREQENTNHPQTVRRAGLLRPQGNTAATEPAGAVLGAVREGSRQDRGASPALCLCRSLN